MRRSAALSARGAFILLLAVLASAPAERAESVTETNARVDEVLETAAVDVPGATIAVHFTGSRLPVSRASVLAWITRASDAVIAYYGRFPVEGATLVIRGAPRGRVSEGFTAYGRPYMRIALGPETTEADLDADWMLTHEFVHLAHPSLGGPWRWLEEGIATYVEPIARVKSGTLSPDEIWRWLITSLPKGLPAAGDSGLDGTSSWGRTYWGGALFCLLADVQIRRTTANRKSIEDALTGVLLDGGDVLATWTLDRTLKHADMAIALDVLRELHARLGSEPVTVDLDALFGALGVSLVSGRILYDDAAPLAWVRRAISATPSADAARPPDGARPATR